MKYHVFLVLSLASILIFSQVNTEIFLFDIESTQNETLVTNGKNISNNKGYDNQPSFINDEQLLYSSTRNNQTDITQYFNNNNSKFWINFTEGGEYSPLKIPNKNAVSAVRLDKNGKQRLYSYNLSNGESTSLIKDLVVAYYTWSDDNTIVSAVIEGNELSLYNSNISEGTNRKYATKVGRSFHKIPGSNLVSFISKKNVVQWQIKSVNPSTGETKLIANTISGVEDICWLNNKTILSGKGSKLYKLTLNKDNDWNEVIDLSSLGITSITRLAINPSANKLAIAGELNSGSEPNEKPIQNTKTETTETSSDSSTEILEIEAIVQRNLNAYNAGDINAFMKDYAEDIKLYTYPNTLRTEGKESMRKAYKDWFDRTPDLRAFIKQRIVIGNKVIDEEKVTANGEIFNAVAIYEVENGLITKVTFIQN